MNKKHEIKTSGYYVRLLLLIYWVLFWLFNVVDKIIGGAHPFFVGRDRYAQIERFFDSIGLGDAVYADLALTLTAILEVFALMFFTGALIYFVKHQREKAKSWFFRGIIFTLLTFTYFSFGDQLFGDHFELLEHGIFWFITLLSYLIFNSIERISLLDSKPLSKKQFRTGIILFVIIGAVTCTSIFYHNANSFIERTQAVEASQITENKYKIDFPFLAGSTAFENSLALFKENNPDLEIDYIYTAPKPLRLGKSDGLIIYIQTKESK